MSKHDCRILLSDYRLHDWVSNLACVCVLCLVFTVLTHSCRADDSFVDDNATVLVSAIKPFTPHKPDTPCVFSRPRYIYGQQQS